MTVDVGLVLVAHSAPMAQGTADLARQMAPDVVIRCAAGDEDGGLGTSLDRVQDALADALGAVDGVVVLADLGSAVLVVEAAFELDPALARRARLVSAPFVEGAVAAAVTAQQGAAREAVAESAEAAVHSIGPSPVLELVESSADDSPAPAGTHASGETVQAPGAPASGAADEATATAQIRNRLGLHARPAALLARSVADLGVPVTVDGADASSVLALMSLGTVAGQRVTVAARGTDAAGAVDVVVGMIEGGFGEE